MDANFTQKQAMSAKMPKQLWSMFTRLSCTCANCAKTELARRKPLSVPKCHNPLGYGTWHSGKAETTNGDIGKTSWEPSFEAGPCKVSEHC
jgi:hypothetical protein